MKTDNRIYHLALNNDFVSNEIESSFRDALLIYSIRHFESLNSVSQENMLAALQKSLQVCYTAGINSKHHFKQIFLFDSKNGTLLIDWRMSRAGFNLMIIQMPTANERLANWVLKLADR